MAEQKVFQWLKGDRAGEFVKWDGEIHNDGELNFLIFTDGSRGNESLLNDYFIEVASEQDGFIDAEMMKPESSIQTLPPEHNPPLRRTTVPAPTPIEAKVEKAENPITRLLVDSKKVPTKIKLDVEVEIPSVDLMKVLSDSYENGEEQVLEFLATTISDIRIKIAKQIWTDIKKKHKSLKNETA